MKSAFKIGVMAASVALAMAPAARAADPAPESLAAAAHVARAKMVAGRDLAAVADGYMCKSRADGSRLLLPLVKANGVSNRRVGQAFDNLYYVGLPFVGAWILKTSDGLVMWDALNNQEEAKTILEPAMRELGLDPAQIKALVITHGHYDHFGGAAYFQQKYGTPVLASAADWDYMYDAQERQRMGLPYVEPPKRDKVIADGEKLSLGGSTVNFVLTPGHTPGTVSSIFDVKDHGVSREISMWGGTAMPATSQGLAQYHNSFHKFWNASQALHTVGTVSAHPFVADNFTQLERRRPTGSNPFVLGVDGYRRLMTVYDECIEAQAAR